MRATLLVSAMDRILGTHHLWPVSYALQRWSAVVQKKVVELVTAAVS